MQWLSRRDYSQHEIRQKLKTQKPNGTPQEIDEILADFMCKGFINDSRFTANYIHWRQQKGFGPLRIYKELQTRGLSNEMIAEHLKITDNAWVIIVRDVWRKHFKTNTPTDFKQRAKQIRFLQYRGFTPEQIHYALGLDTNEEEGVFILESV